MQSTSEEEERRQARRVNALSGRAALGAREREGPDIIIVGVKSPPLRRSSACVAGGTLVGYFCFSKSTYPSQQFLQALRI